MISKNYYFHITLRVLFLSTSIFVFSFLLIQQHYLFCSIALIFVFLSIFTLINYFNKTNQKIAFFFNSVKNENFTLHFSEEVNSKSLKELHASLNSVNELIKETHIKNKLQENYYQEILKHTKTGILTINNNGHILFANTSVKKLFNKQQLNHIRQLKSIDTKLFNLLNELKPFERELIKLTNEREILNLVIKSTEVTLNKESLKLITIDDINSELDEKETESWAKLIRVLAHEIMNTITPISSISESILKYYKNNKGVIPLNSLTEDHIKNTVKGLEIIKNQGNDLMSFVKSYRNVLNVPIPDKKIINVAQLFKKLEILVSKEINLNNIEFKITFPSNDFEIFADEKQICLVITNILKNAIQSLNNQNNSIISMSYGITKNNQKYISIKDNGPGIKPSLLHKIFIPFFTTKTSGSGIGLSLSKQIMQMHGGKLKVYSFLGKETIFTLSF